MGSLTSQIKELLPIDSRSQVDKLLGLLSRRNTVIDAQLRHRICSYIEDSQMKEYFVSRTEGVSCVTSKATFEQERVNVSQLLIRFTPLDSIAKINSLIDTIKEMGGVITTEEKIDVYLKIWRPDLKSYWSAKCLNELTIIPSIPSVKKSVKGKKAKKSTSNSVKKQNVKPRRSPGIINPNSADFNSQMLKESLKSKFEGYEYGLSDW